MKKIISIALSLFMLFSFSVVSFADYQTKTEKNNVMQIGDYYFTLEEVKEGPTTFDAEARATRTFSVSGAISEKDGTLIARVSFTGVVYKGFGNWVFRSIDHSYTIEDNRCTGILFEYGEMGSDHSVMTLYITFVSGASERAEIDFTVDSNGDVEAEWR